MPQNFLARASVCSVLFISFFLVPEDERLLVRSKHVVLSRAQTIFYSFSLILLFDYFLLFVPKIFPYFLTFSVLPYAFFNPFRLILTAFFVFFFIIQFSFFHF